MVSSHSISTVPYFGSFYLDFPYSNVDATLPNVQLIDCNNAKLSFFDKCLIIKYSSGELEYAGLVKVEGFDSILEGYLIESDEAKKGSRVSVTMKGANKALV